MRIRRMLALAAAVVALLGLCRALLRRCRRAALERRAVALITGGSSGLGQALALQYAKAGCCVVVVGRDAAALQRTVSQCLAAGAVGAHAIVADLATPAGTDTVKAEQRRVCSGQEVKYLVLNAGVGAIVPFSCEPRFAEICSNTMAVNFHANVRLLQAFLPQLEHQHRPRWPSHVLAVSSLAGILPSTRRSAYTASKHALQGFMNALRAETCVPITICCPDYLATPFHARAMTMTNEPLATRKHKGQSPEACARDCLSGALHGDAEVMGLQGRLAYCVRPVFTSLVDYIAKQKSLRSLKA